MAKSQNKQNLNIIARVDGAGNVSSEVRKINTAIASTGETAREASSSSKDLGGAFDELAPKIGILNDKLMGMRTTDPSGALKAFAESLTLLPGPLGMVAFGVTSAVAAFFSLSDVLKSDVTPEMDKNVEATQSLADAYLALGDNATVAEARQRIAAQKQLQKTKEQVDYLNTELPAAQERLAQALEAQGRAEYNLRIARADDDKRAILRAQQQVLDANREAKAADAQVKSIDRNIDKLSKKLQIEQASLKTQDEIAAEQERQTEADRRRGEEAAQEILALEAAAQEVRDRQQRAAQAEMAQLEALRVRTMDAIWSADEHSQEASIARQIEAEKRRVDDVIKSEERRAEAYRLIDERAEADARKRRAEAAKKAEAEQAKWLADASRRAEAQLGTGGDAQLDSINAKLAALRSDEMRYLSMGEEAQAQYADQYAQTQAAIVSAEQDKQDRIAQIRAQELQSLYQSAKAEKQALYDKTKRNWALTESAQAAADAQIAAASSVAEALDAWGKGSAVIEAAQMTASGIQATCDAINYTAEAAAHFATGNIVAGLGMSTAAAGKYAAAAAYAKGLIELGFSAFDSSGGGSAQTSTANVPTTSSLTGQQQQGPTEINITMGFSGQAGRLGRYLIEEINAEARTPGGARVSSGVVR